MRRFVALIQVMTIEQDRELVAFFESKGWGFWHWIDGSWLITVNDDTKRVSTMVRDEVKRIVPGQHCLIFEIEGVKGWAGTGPSAPDNDMFEWILSSWKTRTPASDS